MSDEMVQIRKHLADIPELLAEASHYLTPGSAPIDPTSTRGATIYRIPIVPAIFDLLDNNDKALDDIFLNRTNGERRLGVLPTLGLWVSLAYAELDDLGRAPRECCPARAHTIMGEAAWLSEYALDITELHPCCDKCERGKKHGKPGCSCGCFAHDIEQLWVELRQACRIRAEYIPTCPVCATATKRWRLETIYGDDGAPAWWRCTGCAQAFVRDAEVKRIALTQPKMTLRQIATWLGLPLRTLHNWRTEGRFTTDKRGLAEVEHVRRAAQTAGRISA